MGTTNLGRVRPVFQGVWVAGTTYTELDVVYHDGSAYYATASSTGEEPGTGSSWAAISQGWTDSEMQAMLDAEAARATAESGRVSEESGRVAAESGRVSAESARSVWEVYDSGKSYAVGNKVQYNGSSYICILATTAGILPTNGTYWVVIAAAATGTVSEATMLAYNDTLGNVESNNVGGALDELGTLVKGQTSLIGVKFLKASSAPAGTRTYGAVGLTATAGVGAAGSSDFDRFPVYRLRLCNRVAGAVTAYFNEPGFSRSSDVFVEIPKGYYRVWDDGTYLQYALSDKPFPYSKLHPAFMHNNLVQDYVYIGAYMSSYDGSSKHESKTGALPDNNISRTTARTRSKVRGSYAILQDVQIRDWLNILMAVEFATRDMQTAIGRGYCDIPYSASHDTTVAETAVNRIIIANAFADLYMVGQEISIGTSEGNNSIAADRTVTSVDVYDASNKAITFNGAAVNIAIGNNVWSSRQKNGKCDALGQGTGRATGTNGKTAVIYRGVENLWGNIWEWVDNLNIRNNQGYTDIEGRIASYNDTDFGTVYSAMSAAFPAADGYMVTPLIDPVSGLSCLPATVGGGSSSYYCDYYYQNTGDRAAFVGGLLYYGSSGGPWFWLLNSAASDAGWYIGARLLEIPA